MEIFRKLLMPLVASLALAGCGLSDAIEKKDAEILTLKGALAQKQGERAADLEFAERQAGAYLGCAFAFNICPRSTVELGQKRIENGFAGASSLWFFAAVLAKFSAIAAAVGILLWLPRHLRVKFTKPRQDEIEAANLLISEAQTRVSAATARQIETERLAALAEAKAKELAAQNHLKTEHLAAAEAALNAKNQQIEAANQDIKEKKRIQAAFKKF